MKNLKFLSFVFVAMAVLFAQTGAAFAAPAMQDGFINGPVTEVSCETNADTGVSTYFITVEVSEGVFETVHVDQATAELLGIVTAETVCNEDGTVDGAVLGMEVSVDPATVISDEESGEPQHPVALVLSLFFSDITDYDTIMSAHEDGNGFGVLAQALWLSMKMEGDSETFLAIVQAKKEKDFSAFVLEDGSTPQNWGQFKKAILNGDKKGNLGVVMSGHADNPNSEDAKSNNGKGPGNDNSNNGKGHDKKKDK